MNIFLWVLQFLLALHTLIGAIWKFSNSAQSIPSLSALPHEIWLSMSVVEMLCSVALVLPLFYRPVAILAPIAAIVIAAEMLIFSGFHMYSGVTEHGPMMYWLVVAAICAFIAFGRFVLKPLQ